MADARKPRPGRPPKPEGTARIKRVQVLMTPGMERELRELAASAGRSLGQQVFLALLRDMVLGNVMKPLLRVEPATGTYAAVREHQVAAFLSGHSNDKPSDWMTDQGTLRPSEKHDRVALLEAHAPKWLMQLMEDTGTDTEMLILAYGHLSRRQLVDEFLGGQKWQPPQRWAPARGTGA
jgi:hypothetical protein